MKALLMNFFMLNREYAIERSRLNDKRWKADLTREWYTATYIRMVCVPIIVEFKTETHRQGHGLRMLRRAVVGWDIERDKTKER